MNQSWFNVVDLNALNLSVSRVWDPGYTDSSPQLPSLLARLPGNDSESSIYSYGVYDVTTYAYVL